MTRLTDEQLQTARALEDWDTLWLAADPWIKFAMSELRCGDEDALQKARLAAGQAVRSWDPTKGAFSTHVTNTARFALLNYLKQNVAGGVGSRHIAETGRYNKFVSVDEKILSESHTGTAEQTTYLDRLTYEDLDDSTPFERLMQSSELQNYADRVLRFIPEGDAAFFRGVAKAGGVRAFARAHGLSASSVSDRLRAITKKLSVHSHKIDYIQEATPDLGAANNGRWWIAEMAGNPWADWAYKPTDEDLAAGSEPRDDGFKWSLGAVRMGARNRRGVA